MLNGEAVRGVRPWTVTSEGDIWFTARRSDGTVFAFVDPQYGVKGINAPAGRKFTLKSVKTSADSIITVLGQEGGVEWKQDASGLHVTVSCTHTIQLVKTSKAAKKAAKGEAFTWGPDWPIAVKITNAQAPVAGGK
jgi:alpha-L-fucosidase